VTRSGCERDDGDPSGAGRERCATGRRALAESLAQTAHEALRDGRAHEAIRHWAAALQLQPGRMDRLRDMASAWEALGDEPAALLCHRNTVPPVLDRECFLADLVEQRVLPRAACPGVEHHPGFDEQPRALSLPRCNVPLDEVGQFRRRRTAPASAFTSVVAGGELWFDGFNVLLLNAGRQIVHAQARGNRALVMAALSTRAPVRLGGTTCFLDARSGSNYYHWMMDVVPKLALLERAGIGIDEIDHWLVRRGQPFQEETLAHLGIDPDKVVGGGAETHVRCERLVVPRLKNDIGERPSGALGLGMGQWLPAWLRRTFGPADGTVHAPTSGRPGTGRRIFVSRAASAGREIRDETALARTLAAYGFERVEPERLSVAGQARLMAEADTVLAVHGAALANIAFCRPGTLVLEVFGSYIVPCYWALAGIAGLDHACFMTGRCGERDPLRRAAGVSRDRQSGLDVPLDELSAWLEKVLAGR